MKMIEKHEINFIHVRLFLPLPNGRDGPSPQEYEESGVPGWRRLCEENENPAMVLAREFSISDSANPFYLKLRNSIPPAPTSSRHEGIHPCDFSTPLGIPCPRLSSSAISAPRNGGGWTFLYFPAGSGIGRCAANPDFPPPRYWTAKVKIVYILVHARAK